MIVQPGMQQQLKMNDRAIYSKEVKLLSQYFNSDLSLTLHLLYFVLFLYDESIICYFICAFLHIFLSHTIDELKDSEDVIPGISRTHALNRLSRPTMMNGAANDSNTSTENAGNSDNQDPDELNSLFSDWSVDKKKKIVKKLLSFFALFWVVIIIYQLFFCITSEFPNTCYTILGSLNKKIKESAYGKQHDSNEVWSVRNAFTNGSLLYNIIGDTKFRSKFSKLIAILSLDFIIIVIQLLAFLLNYGVGFDLIERIETDNEELDASVGQRKFDGLQGRTQIFKMNPVKTFQKLYR